MVNILLVSADVSLAGRLAAEGYEVDVAATGDEAGEPAGCVLFDLCAPGRHAFDVCRELRAGGSNVPIVLLTSRAFDGVIGLRLGADDYVMKPVDGDELLARIEALLRRCSRGATRADGGYSSRNLSVNFRTTEVRRDGRVVPLTALELQLLRYLIEHRDEVLSRDEILDKVWGYDAVPVTRTVDVRIASLRRKLERDPAQPELIVTVHGTGYRFVDL